MSILKQTKNIRITIALAILCTVQLLMSCSVKESIITSRYHLSGDNKDLSSECIENSIVIGQKGSGKSIESYSIQFNSPEGKDITIAYRSHIQGYGWFQWSPSGTEITSEQKAGIESIQIMLSGKDAFMYDVSYRIAAVGQDWQEWVTNGAIAGAPGQNLSIETIEIKLTLHDDYVAPIWTITEYSDDSGNQAEFYTMKNNDDGTLIVIDGGYDANTEQVRSIININGGKVDHWFLTHYDEDHACAFNSIYADPQGIEIGAVYCTPLDYDYYLECAAERWWDVPWVYETFLAQTAGDDRIHYLARDDVFEIDGLTIEVFNSYDQMIVDTGSADVANYGSLLFKISGEKDTFLVCGDVYGDLWIQLSDMYGEKLEAEYVQLGHHGNNHVPPEEWAVVNADVAFFDGPAWLTESDDYDAKALNEWCQSNGITTYDFGTAPNSLPFE